MKLRLLFSVFYLRLRFSDEQTQHHGSLVCRADSYARRHQAETVGYIACTVAAEIHMPNRFSVLIRFAEP